VRPLCFGGNSKGNSIQGVPESPSPKGDGSRTTSGFFTGSGILSVHTWYWYTCKTLRQGTLYEICRMTPSAVVKLMRRHILVVVVGGQ
jgi:hypothetical protein